VGPHVALMFPFTVPRQLDLVHADIDDASMPFKLLRIADGRNFGNGPRVDAR